MKKFLVVLLAVLCFAVPALAQTTNLAGEWKLTKAIASGVVMPPEAAGFSQTLVLNPDGTFTSCMTTINGIVTEESGTWSQLGVMVTLTPQPAGESVSLSLQSDGTLRLAADRTFMFYTQIEAAPQATALPQTTSTTGSGLLPSGQIPSTGSTAPAESSFEGQWVLTQAAANGQTIDAATAGIQMTVTFNADGACTVWNAGETLTCTWTQNGAAANVTEPNGFVTVFTMRSDGTITADSEGVTFILARQGGAAAPSPVNPPAALGQTVTGKGFTLQVPQGWMAMSENMIQQMTQTFGQEAVDAAGLRQQLQLAQSMGILLYYAADFNASVNVAQESAQGVTMDTLPTLEADYAAAYASAGMTNYDMAGPVTFSGRTYYTGTYDAPYPVTQYYHIVNGVFYTITLTNVSDADAATILGSFTVNQ